MPESGTAGLACLVPQVSDKRMTQLERYRKALEGRRAPLAWVDLDLLESNAREIAKRMNGKSLRIGTKSIRSRAILDLLFKWTGASTTMGLSASEAVWLSQHGVRDCVVGYPSVNDGEIRAVLEAIRAGAAITLMADAREHLDRYQRLASEAGVRLSVWIDVDASTPIPGVYFGVHRSSLTSVEKLKALIEAGPWPSLSVEGFMTYEAQVAGVQDRPPNAWQGPVVRWLKRRSIRILAERRRALAAIFSDAGYHHLKANGGGTGSLRTTSQDPVITEITAGSGFYSPALFDHYDDFKFSPAAGFALEIVRHSHEHLWTAFAGGYAASGVGPDRAPTPYLPEGLKLLPNEGAGEVQTPLSSPVPLSLGDLVFFRHAKAGELCERFNELHLIRGDRVVDVVKTYRGEGQAFA